MQIRGYCELRNKMRERRRGRESEKVLSLTDLLLLRLNNHEREEGEKKKPFQCRNTAISSLEVKPVSKKNVFLGTFSFF